MVVARQKSATTLPDARNSGSSAASPRGRRGLARLGIAVTVGLIGAAGACAAEETSGRQAAKLPVPRYVSLKADRVNVRIGPTKNHEVAWVYMRAALPVEITAESENWRRIRDWEGAEGWVYHSLLSGRRTAIVAPKSKQELVPLHDASDAVSAVTARLQAGVIGSVKACSGTWCHITGEKFDGWIAQERLWGVYPNEKIE